MYLTITHARPRATENTPMARVRVPGRARACAPRSKGPHRGREMKSSKSRGPGVHPPVAGCKGGPPGGPPVRGGPASAPPAPTCLPARLLGMRARDHPGRPVWPLRRTAARGAISQGAGCRHKARASAAQGVRGRAGRGTRPRPDKSRHPYARTRVGGSGKPFRGCEEPRPAPLFFGGRGGA